MAGPYTDKLYIKSKSTGQTKRLSLYDAPSAAVGTYLPVEFSQIATVNSPTDWDCTQDCIITDFIAGPATGEIEIVKNGAPDQFTIDMAAMQANNAGRKQPGYVFNAGCRYRFKVVAELAA